MSQPDQEQDHRVREQSNARVQFPLDAKSYKIVAEIGTGVSTIVYKALCLPLNSAPVAIKSIDLDQPTRRGRRASSSSSSSSGPTSDVIDNVRREAKMMSLLSHPNILKAHCSFTVGRHLWVVMPFMSAGSLHSILSFSSPGGLPEAAIAPILRDILLALSYLHGQGHLHRDVKAGNILLDSHGSVKLADFGVSASLHDSPLTDLAGTPYWMAPEVFHSLNGYGTKADIWSFGITALELAHGRPPLSHLPLSKSLVMKITKRFRFSDYENCGGENVTKKFSKAFKEMVGMCLNQDPAKRPTADRLLKHSFFKNSSKGLEFLVRNVLQGLPSVEERFRVLKSTSGGDREDCDDGDGDEGLKEKRRRISGWNFNEDGFELDPVFPTESEDESAGEIVKEGELNPSSLSQGGKLPELIRSSPDDNDPSSPSQGNELCDASELTKVSPGSQPGEVGESDEPTQSELGESDPSSPSQTLEHPEPADLNSPSVQADTPAESSPSEFGESAPSWESQSESTPSQGEVDRERVLRDLLLLRRSIEMERATLADILRLIGVADQAEAPPTREAYLEGVAEKARSELEMERKRNSELELEIEFLKMQLQRDDQ